MYHTLVLMITHVWHLHTNGYTSTLSYTFSTNGHTDTCCVWTGIVLGFLHMPTPLRFKTTLWRRYYYYSCYTVEDIKVPWGIACQNCVRREFLAQVCCHSLPVPCSQDSFGGWLSCGLSSTFICSGHNPRTLTPVQTNLAGDQGRHWEKLHSLKRLTA